MAGQPYYEINIPEWGGWEHWLLRIEDRIDGAIQSNVGWLNFVLGPVRDFVRWVLHPLFAFGDFLFSWLVQLVDWCFGLVRNLAWDAIRAIQAVMSYAIDAAQWFAGLARGYADTLFAGVGHLITEAERRATDGASWLVGNLRGWAETAITDARTLARTLADDALHGALFLAHAADQLLQAAIDDVRSFADAGLHYLADATVALYHKALDFAGAVEGRVTALAHALVEKASSVLGGLIDLLRRDVWDKVLGALEDFLTNEWAWAFRLLKLLEHSAEWIAWLGTHVVQEAIDTYELAKELGGADVRQLARWGAAIGAG